jgi:NNP family nitrate/nitrite transporter-like MFS transporter
VNHLDNVTARQQHGALGLSTFSFTVCFAVWTIFSIIGVQIKQDLGLSDTAFGILVATPILTGSVSRIFLGIWTDQYGGRLVFSIVMAATSVAVFLLSTVDTYVLLLVAALGVGLAGGSFAVGIAYVSRWYDSAHQGTALGVFGMGNVGAAVTNFGAPFLMVAIGWQQTAIVYSIVLFVTAILFFILTKEDPATVARRKKGARPKSTWMELEPLQKLQVWRFSLYYFFVFGAFVALALWLPRYYVGVYDLDIRVAGMLAAAYALPGSIFRALGGWLSDRVGARTVMYWTFIASVVICFFLSYPATNYVVAGIEGPMRFELAIGLVPFVILTVFLGFFMSLGKAAVYKHIPVYYPENVGAVGGLVGMIGGLGGFILPICFGIMNDIIGVWTSCFMLLFALVSIALIWMHFSVRLMERGAVKELGMLPELPGMIGIHEQHHKVGPRRAAAETQSGSHPAPVD